jgi:hypothetical protein
MCFTLLRNYFLLYLNSLLTLTKLADFPLEYRSRSSMAHKYLPINF